MAGGYTEQILRVNLTTGTISTIPTSKYKQFMGGKGIGTAIFWDLCQNKAIKGTDPGNVVTLMTSPLAGTVAGANGRTEVQGIGIYADSLSAPNKTADSSENQDWYTRANVGGRFAAALKSVGWDGIVLEGKANALVYLKLVNDKVTLEDAAFIKGMDCYDTQLNLWGRLMGNARTNEWLATGAGSSTQMPAIMCISAAGERQSRIACLIHDSGDAAAFGGFGGVWGSKNLKAITVQGNNAVDIADPKALMEARLWLKSKLYPTSAGPEKNVTFRAAGCTGCFFPCRKRYNDTYCNDSQCIESYWYAARNLLTTSGSLGNLPGHPKTNNAFSALDQRRSTDYAQRYGLNAAETIGLHQYLEFLYENGDAGPGKKINTALLVMGDKSYGTLGWAEEFCREICNPVGIGKELAEGASRFSRKYGLDARDTESGFLQALQWGNFSHFSLPNTDFCYCSMLGSRDHNEHTLQKTWGPLASAAVQKKYSVEAFVKIMAEKLIPYEGDPYMVSHGTDDVYGIYSPHQAKFISWMEYYGNSWKQSALYCDQSQLFASFIDQGSGRAKEGVTPEAEPRFWNAVTGQNLTFKDGMIKGKAIWNLERAIWALQGRHRDQEKFAGFAFKDGACFGGCGKNEYDPATRKNVQYMYPVGPHQVTYAADMKTVTSATHCYPVYKDGKWAYDYCDNFKLDKAGVETFKTNYYTLEGWDAATGRPTRAALTGSDIKNVGIDLTNVADALQAAGKLGK